MAVFQWNSMAGIIDHGTGLAKAMLLWDQALGTVDQWFEKPQGEKKKEL